MPNGVRHRTRRYPSDTTIAEWALLEPLLPIEASQTKTGGRPEKWPRRQIVDAIRYLLDNGANGGPYLRTSRPVRPSTGFLRDGTGPRSSPSSGTSCAVISARARAAARSR
ncbi:transposase [Streptomyces sp. NPDC029674]|uniref:transposase n=1 Tax=Streptomyces sp. NPDC029674 TaxID=3365297 RepID=UPI00384AA311